MFCSNFSEVSRVVLYQEASNPLLEAERPDPEISAGYFSDSAALVDRLMKVVSVALQASNSAAIAQDAYAAILEASLHSRAIWDSFTRHPDLLRTHQDLLLAHPNQSIRDHVARKIASICGGDLPSTCPVTKGETASHFWSVISAVVPLAGQYAGQSQQLFEIAEHVFRANDEYDRNEDYLRSLLARLSALLLNHEHQEYPGREQTEYVVLGLTKLLLYCILSIKSFKKPVNAGSLMRQVFKKYIFVERYVNDTTERLRITISPFGILLHVGSMHCTRIPLTKCSARTDSESSEHPPLPILESHTRQELYDLMLSLAEDRSTYNLLLQLAEEVENEDIGPVLSPNLVDRTMEIRSTTGYVGLYNPRAICYMNSLLTQLFMNLNFRKFMLGLDVKEASGSQRLLFETQRLFAQMQNSYRKSTDPREFAACVNSLDKMPIDIGVQMDADEFYNLLFDQWEAQLLQPEHKQHFRTFYGGQTLNQIKSKECEHVSERSEPFFAVQCDIAGKANLQESLQAYVQGDVMEGDNKYKCESCDGKFVDAVKRTCLKEVPDNLIFHLKRFEFDLNDFSRKKIYDHFAFPESLDISPYKVDHLADPTTPCTEDIFDLVGVLVHTGTCENGHYYSYIRQRPSSIPGVVPTWVEFNDSEVMPFDPAEIAERTFGGFAEGDGYNRPIKQYSAYMLFYQRRTAINEDQLRQVASSTACTPRIDIPKFFEEEINIQNTQFVREYALFDPVHAKFVRQLHGVSRKINHGTCSENHSQETHALHIILAHLGHIAWRQQNPEIFLDLLLQLRRSMLSCAICCDIALQWLAEDDHALTNTILRCTHPRVRSQVRSLIVDSLKLLRQQDPTLYGMDLTDSDMEVDSIAPKEGTFTVLARRFRKTADESCESTRGWEDFYLMLTQLSELGYFETAELLNRGLLFFCLRIFCAHANKKFENELPEFARILDKRRGIFNRMVGFVWRVLSQMDPTLPTIPDRQTSDRLATFDREQTKFPLARREAQALTWWSDDLKEIAVLDKILEVFDSSKVEQFYPGDIVKFMLAFSNESIQMNIGRTVLDGLTLDPPYVDAYVYAALYYCEACSRTDTIPKVFTAVSKLISSPARVDEDRVPSGEAVLTFYSGLLRAQNEDFFLQRHPHAFHHMLMLRSRAYGMFLLCHYNDHVRKATSNFLQQLYGNDDAFPPETIKVKYNSARDLLIDLMHKFAYEREVGRQRSFVIPLVDTCRVLVQQLYILAQAQNPEEQQYQDLNDTALICQFQQEVEAHMRTWLHDTGTPTSQGDTFDQSDYASESDDAHDLLDN
jgi:ubiquitin carboxyl-terminal hydrolase 34